MDDLKQIAKESLKGMYIILLVSSICIVVLFLLMSLI